MEVEEETQDDEEDTEAEDDIEEEEEEQDVPVATQVTIGRKRQVSEYLFHCSSDR